MNLIGKIFVGLIAAMNIILLSLVLVLYASHKNWKDVAEKKDEQIKTVESETAKLSKIQSELTRTIDAEYLAYQKEVAALKTKSEALTQENDLLRSRESTLEDEIAERVKVVESNNLLINEFRKNIEILTSGLADAQQQRTDYLKHLASAIGEMHEKATFIGDIKDKNQKLTAEYDKALAILNQNGLDPNPELYESRLPYKVQGQVNSVQAGENGFISVSLGSDDGLKPNQTLEVYRDDLYLGRIEIVSTEFNSAICRVLPQYRQGTIMEGDHVTSQFE